MKYLESNKFLQPAITVAALFAASAKSMIVHAQLINTPDVSGIEPIHNYGVPAELNSYEGATSGASFAFYLVFIWRALIFVAGLAVLLALVTGAIEWINAGGDKAKIEKAREKMTQAVIGFVVLIGLLAIAQFIQVVFGINILNPSIPTANDLGAPTL